MVRVLKRIVKGVIELVRCTPAQHVVCVPVLRCELLKGRTALITGGNGGIGFAIAEACLCAGAKVIISGRDEDKLKASAAKLNNKGDISYILMDNTNISAFDNILSGTPPFDILVNNAGYVGGGFFGDTQESEYDKVMDVNLKSSYFLSESVSKLWIRNGTKGNILNICSASSLRPGQSPYILSKWGLRSLTVGMAKSLIKYGIVVNGLAPGCTNTRKFSHDGNISNPRNPSGRMVTVEEVANMAVILVSSLSRMIVGDVVYMTGGGGITTFDD